MYPPHLNEEQKIQDLIEKAAQYPNLKLLGLDIGRKKIGIAICHLQTTTITPYKVLLRSGTTFDLNTVAKIASELAITDIVVGVPLVEGVILKPSQHIVDFAHKLPAHLNIYLQDEAFSSFEAIETLKSLDIRRKKRDQIDDAIAATVILKDFLQLLTR